MHWVSRRLQVVVMQDLDMGTAVYSGGHWECVYLWLVEGFFTRCVTLGKSLMF